MAVWKEFKEFLSKYKIVGLAVAFVMGDATTGLVKSLVNDIVMPLINPLLPGGAWETTTFSLGPFVLRWGAFASNLLHFFILAAVVFFVVKKLLKS